MIKRIFILGCLFCCVATAYAQSWIQLSDFGGGVRTGMCSFTIGNKTYVGLGGDHFTTFNDFWEYNAATDTWKQIADFPGTARYTATAFSIGNKGYVGTGITHDNNYLSDFWEYDTALDKWSQKADFAGPARSGAVGFSINGMGYIGTGTGAKTYYNDLWAYDPLLNKWVQKNNFGGNARRYASSFVINNTVYVGMGQTAVGHRGTFYEYNAAADTWTQRATHPENVSGCVSFVINKQGYMGLGYDGAVYKKTLYKYTPSADTWTALPDFDGGMRGNAVGFSAGNYGYVCVGTTLTGLKKDVWKFAPPLGIAITKREISCFGYDDGSISVTPTGGKEPYRYYWAPNLQEITGLADSLKAGTYTVKVKDAANDSLEEVIIIGEPAPLDTSIIINGNTSFCYGDTVFLNAGFFDSYLWSNNETTRGIAIATSGKYRVIVTDNNGCVDTSSVIAITAFPLPPVPTITSTGNVLVSSANAGNQWYLDGNIISGANSKSYAVIQNGSYTVIVTDSNGCQAQSAAYLVANLGISGVKNSTDISIYPNPNTGVFYISKNNTEIQKVSIYSLLGKLVFEIKGYEPNSEIVIESPGLYIVIVELKDKIITNRLLVK